MLFKNIVGGLFQRLHNILVSIAVPDHSGPPAADECSTKYGIDFDQNFRWRQSKSR